jgi:quinol-cytochrome oxidoreductase complex cytochrome b subunit
MSTPAHIVPEWYFLWVYAILRSIPNKLGGVAAIGLVFVALLALPFINTSQTRSSSFRPIYKKFFWLLVADTLILVWIGQRPVEDPYILIGQLASIYFFIYFLIIIPFLGKFENFLIYFNTYYDKNKVFVNK